MQQMFHNAHDILEMHSLKTLGVFERFFFFFQIFSLFEYKNMVLKPDSNKMKNFPQTKNLNLWLSKGKNLFVQKLSLKMKS